jgi:hypothetical protein
MALFAFNAALCGGGWVVRVFDSRWPNSVCGVSHPIINS